MSLGFNFIALVLNDKLKATPNLMIEIQKNKNISSLIYLVQSYELVYAIIIDFGLDG